MSCNFTSRKGLVIYLSLLYGLSIGREVLIRWSTFQRLVKQFLEKANANTPEVDQRLKSVDEVVVILSSLIQDAVVGTESR